MCEYSRRAAVKRLPQGADLEIVRVALLSALVGALLSLAIGANAVHQAREHDFLDLYMGARIALSGDFAHLHDYDRQLAVEQSIAPDPKRPLIPFMRPPFYAGVLAPLALLPFQSAFVFWLCLQCALLLMVWAIAYRRFGPSGLVLSAFFLLPGLGIAHGQDSMFVLLLLMVGYLLLERDRDLAAGAVLGLTLFKFHLFPFLPVMFVLHRRWRAVAGYSGVGAALLATWIWLGSFPQYFALIFDHRVTQFATPDLFLNVEALPANFGVDSLALRLALMALAGVLTFISTGREACPAWFSAAIAGSLAFTPHVYKYDGAALLVPLLLGAFASEWRWTRYAAWVAACPLVYVAAVFGRPWGILPPLSLLLFTLALALERYALPSEVASVNTHFRTAAETLRRW